MEAILTDSEFEILINEFYSKQRIPQANLKPTRKSLRKKSVRT
jgi:hypothetical protein